MFAVTTHWLFCTINMEIWAGMTIKLLDTSAVCIDHPPTQGPNDNESFDSFVSLERRTECTQWRFEHFSRQLRYAKSEAWAASQNLLFSVLVSKINRSKNPNYGNIILSVLMRRELQNYVWIVILSLYECFTIQRIIRWRAVFPSHDYHYWSLSIHRRLETYSRNMACVYKQGCHNSSYEDQAATAVGTSGLG